MKFAEKIKFSVDEFNITINKPSFMVLSIDVISEGVNKHNTAFTIEDIERNISKLNNIPLNCLFTLAETDFKAHAWTKQELKDQVAIGVIPETNNARIVEKKGKKFLRVNAIVWKYMFPQAEAILKRRKQVAISMEINPLDGYKAEGSDVMFITEWDYEAVTMLGYGVTPAIDNADATVIKFSSNEDYFRDTMVKYENLMDCYSIPAEIKDNIETELKKEQVNPDAITQANGVLNKVTLNYSEIIALKETIMSLDDDSKSLMGGEEFLKWTDAIEKERNGGTDNLEKLKELLEKKFSGDLIYVDHNETTVFCFDYESAQFKSFKYTYEEAELEADIKFAVEDEFEVVVKVEGSDEFKAEATLTEGEVVADAVMYSVKAFSEIKEKFATKEERIAELEKELEGLKNPKEKMDVGCPCLEDEEREEIRREVRDGYAVEKAELEQKIADAETKILEYAELSTEIEGLKKFKADKEQEEKQVKVNALYARYSELLTEEELKVFNEKAETMAFSELEKEVKSVVLPKVEANYQALKNAQTLDEKEKDSLKYTKTSNEKAPETKKSNNLLDSLRNV